MDFPHKLLFFFARNTQIDSESKIEYELDIYGGIQQQPVLTTSLDECPMMVDDEDGPKPSTTKIIGFCNGNSLTNNVELELKDTSLIALHRAAIVQSNTPTLLSMNTPLTSTAITVPVQAAHNDNLQQSENFSNGGKTQQRQSTCSNYFN